MSITVTYGSHLLSLSFLSFLQCKIWQTFSKYWGGGIKAPPSPPPNFLRGTITLISDYSQPDISIEAKNYEGRGQWHGRPVYLPAYKLH